MFDQQIKNVDGSGFGNKDYFLSKCREYGLNIDEIHLFTGSSAELSISFSKNENLNLFRLFSIDGGHTKDLTFNDLSIATFNLVSGGIIILDDVTNIDSWPGVIEGMLSWFTMFPGEFGPFFVGHNKVFIASKEYHEIYYSLLISHPFWSQYLSSEPITNKNPHKSPLSGKNKYTWGGFSYLKLITAPSMRDIRREWSNNINIGDII